MLALMLVSFMAVVIALGSYFNMKLRQGFEDLSDAGLFSQVNVEMPSGFTLPPPPAAKPPPAENVIPKPVKDADEAKPEPKPKDPPANGTEKGTNEKDGVEGGKGTDSSASYIALDALPQFPGGNVAMTTFIQQHLRYPVLEYQQRKGGRVVVSVEVKSSGELTEYRIVQSAGANLDAEAIRLLRLMPNWDPAIYQGSPINFQVKIPITFNARRG